MGAMKVSLWGEELGAHLAGWSEVELVSQWERERAG